jgi:tetratricopeptide (TPR) repeat protein
MPNQIGNRLIGIESADLYPVAVLLVLTALLGMLIAARGAEADRSETKPGPGAILATPADVETEFHQLEADDDAAQAEVEQWKRENAERKTRGGGLSDNELEARIQARFEPIQKRYQSFLERHSAHAAAHLAYGCFLNDRQDENGARREWEKALELDPKNAAVYNNLAGSYSEGGPASKAFDFFNKAIELKPTEAAYYHNFGTTLYVLRKSGTKYYGVDEQGVLAKVIQLYSNAVRLDATNFAFATDLAQTYYALKPVPFEAALVSWTNALSAAKSETEREDVFVHLARVKMLLGAGDKSA